MVYWWGGLRELSCLHFLSFVLDCSFSSLANEYDIMTCKKFRLHPFIWFWVDSRLHCSFFVFFGSFDT